MTGADLRKKYIAVIQDWYGMSRASQTHHIIIDIYNTIRPIPRGYVMGYSDNYCAATVSAAAQVLQITDIIPPNCDTGTLISDAKRMGIWVENDAHTPNTGDLIVYNWNDSGVGDCSSRSSHVGAVIGVNDGVIKVIEGNKGAIGVVGYREIEINGRYIRGFVCPDYEGKAKSMSENNRKFGVDLSEFQKGIDFNKLKANGVEFVILRGGDGDYQDKAFDALYASADRCGLPVGAYWFSRATTVQRAKQEAETMCRRLKGKRIQLPVYIDCEANALRSIGKRALTDVVLAWADVVRAEGYIPGVYTTEEWLNNYMILSELSGLEKWIAKWSASKPKLDCGMWQFGGETNYLRSPKIAGYIVDQNYMYKNYVENDMKRFYTLADLKADENAKKYYLPTVEKLLAKGAGSKGRTGDDTIIDLGEDTVRMLAILDKIGVLESNNATVNAAEIAALIKVPTADEIAADIANRISNG